MSKFLTAYKLWFVACTVTVSTMAALSSCEELVIKTTEPQPQEPVSLYDPNNAEMCERFIREIRSINNRYFGIRFGQDCTWCISYNEYEYKYYSRYEVYQALHCEEEHGKYPTPLGPYGR